ncbi:cytochrome P450 [Colletotrichum graminicola]|uniref:Cytochrome P450 n=1 Tax=Colletotrichum graminicola (strain M1.001 / M2 / FGSC 10212) TaxID=645133 RepID=E3QV09_COLGM|nr:cytochrome P450 [Colletotrichum graminicola M1.001]EFQ34699.1 cytochrome P450 [Colletotrichum graminicola M1.001]WDK16946.1 cytochrome P450 [Colletotrichum graminicola]
MAIITVILALKQRVLDHALQSVAISVLLVSIIYIVANEFIRANARIAKLDGPRGMPLIGNLWDIRFNAAEQYRRWAQEFGGVYQIQLGNVPIVVVNTSAAAKVLFGRHAQALSSRPEFYTFHKVLSDTAGTTIGTSPYSDSLKRRRKGAASALNRPSVSTYVPHLDVESRDFIKELYEYGKAGQDPVDPMPMIQRFSLSLALTLNWGVRMSSQKDGLFKEITHVEEEISRFRSTTGNLQDYIPLLRLNPVNMQSAKAREMRNRRDAYLTALNRSLDERMANGTHKPCIQANVIMDKEAKLNKAELTSISLTMLSGGLDTLTTQVAWFVAMLAQRPDIQDKAVVAIRDFYSEKQPMCNAKDDRECKYIVALVKESLRYYTVLRLALPRASVRDVPYGQTIIPKGSVIFLNAWACNMDSELWPDPEVFRPERWLEQPDAPLFTYGIGYRMCTGYLLANRELYIVYMRLLNSFKIEKYDDVDHLPISGNADATSLVSMPRPYRAKFLPRDINTLCEVLYDGNQKA